MKIALISIGVLLFGLTHAQTDEGIKKINGTNLYVKKFGAGPPLVVVHGGPGLNHTYFLPHFESLAKDFTVVLYDQRASGRSATPSRDSVNLDFFVKDIDAIRQHFGLAKINLLGHSWGAILAIQYGLDFPSQVETLILCNPVPLSHEFDTQIAAIQAQRRTKNDSIDRAAIVGSTDFKEGKSAAMEKLMVLSFRHSFYNPENILKLKLALPSNFNQASWALFGGLGKDLAQYNYYDSISSFKFPLLVMHGDADAVPFDVTAKIQKVIPNAKTIRFAGSGHFIFIEELEKFKMELVGFLKK